MDAAPGPSRKKGTETVRFWRPPGLEGMELLHAHYRTQNFKMHFHEGFAVGVIEAGALGFHYLRQNMVAAAGQINLAVPGEVHNGFAKTRQGWRYRMFYFEPSWIEQALNLDADRTPGTIFFKTGVINDPWLARRIHTLHQALEDPHAPQLEMESRWVWVMNELVGRYAFHPRRGKACPAAPHAVRRIQDYIQAHFNENITLSELASLTGLSRYHLLRVFKNQVGLPPHSYQNLVQASSARHLLRQGRPIAEVALDAGFFDQSHLNRVFKQIYGVTPGQYRNSIQDPRTGFIPSSTRPE